MADQALRKAYDRCHTQKLSCVRDGPPSVPCVRCLKAGAVCSTGQSLRNKRHRSKGSAAQTRTDTASESSDNASASMQVQPATSALSVPPMGALAPEVTTPRSGGTVFASRELWGDAYRHLFPSGSAADAVPPSSDLDSVAERAAPGTSLPHDAASSTSWTPAFASWDGFETDILEWDRDAEPAALPSNHHVHVPGPTPDMPLPPPAFKAPHQTSGGSSQRLRTIAQISIDVFEITAAIDDSLAATNNLATDGLGPRLNFRLTFERMLSLALQFLLVLQGGSPPSGPSSSCPSLSLPLPSSSQPHGSGGSSGTSSSNLPPPLPTLPLPAAAPRPQFPPIRHGSASLRADNSGTQLMLESCYLHLLEALSALLRLTLRRLTEQRAVGYDGYVLDVLDFPPVIIGSCNALDAHPSLRACVALELLHSTVERASEVLLGVDGHPRWSRAWELDEREKRSERGRRSARLNREERMDMDLEMVDELDPEGPRSKGTAQLTMKRLEAHVFASIRNIRRMLKENDRPAGLT